MSGATAKSPNRATYADLEAVRPHLVAEIIGGRLHTTPRPASRHARAASRIGIGLGRPFDVGIPFDSGIGGPGGWVILDEPELHLGMAPDVRPPDVLVPDLAGWRRESMPEIPDVAAFTLKPDWVCEVLSASTEAFDRAEKMPVYAREGVGHAWLIDPLIQTLELFHLDSGSWRLVATHVGEAKVRAEPFDAIELDLAMLWER